MKKLEKCLQRTNIINCSWATIIGLVTSKLPSTHWRPSSHSHIWLFIHHFILDQYCYWFLGSRTRALACNWLDFQTRAIVLSLSLPFSSFLVFYCNKTIAMYVFISMFFFQIFFQFLISQKWKKNSWENMGFFQFILTLFFEWNIEILLPNKSSI